VSVKSGELHFFEDDFLVLTVHMAQRTRGVKLVPICEPLKHPLTQKGNGNHSESQYEHIVVPVAV
jgi:hypothetical protein